MVNKKKRAERQTMILAYVQARPGQSIYAVAAAVGGGYRRCHDNVQEMIKNRQLEVRFDDYGRKSCRLYLMNGSRRSHSNQGHEVQPTANCSDGGRSEVASVSL